MAPEIAKAEQLTKQPAGVDTWDWAPDSRRVYFSSLDKFDEDEKARRDKRFTVNIRNAETPTASLWAVALEEDQDPGATPPEPGRYSVMSFNVSDDGKWIGVRGGSTKRYERNITQEGLYSDLTCSRPRLAVSSG